MATEWRLIRCSGCGGHGVVSAYSAHDFEGAAECDDCGGTGTLYVSPADRLCMYPGGPFRGSEPGAYEKTSPVAQC